MSGGAGSDAMQMGMMMGMMAAGGRMGMVPPGMPPMGMVPPGMLPMGLPPGMLPPGAPGAAPEEEGVKRKKKRAKDAGSSEDRSRSASRSGSRSEAPSRGRRASSRREPTRVEEVERFLDDNRINDEACGKIRALSPASQKQIIARPLTGDVQNPSKVMIARVRELQSQNERTKGGTDAWAAWNGAMMGATPEAISKYIEENDLDESASRQLRALPPHQQVLALKWDLSGFRNPSAKFMSMANGLGTSPSPSLPFMGGMPLPGMPMMPMGMRPMGMPTMPGMPMPGMPGMPMLGPPGAPGGVMPGIPRPPG